MKIRVAVPSDASKLNEFYMQFPVKGAVNFKLDRSEDFFANYKIQSENFRTYILESDSDQSVQGMASFIFRKTRLDDKIVNMALATDLRIAPQRKAIMEWSQHFLPVMSSLQNEVGIQHFFSLINLGDPGGGQNTFTRSGLIRRQLPRYHLYRKINLTSLHGRFPWAPKPLEFVRVRPGSLQNLEALLNYILKRSNYRPFSSVWDMDTLEKKIKNLIGFNLDHFLIAFDARENVIGCLAPWNNPRLQKWIPMSYSLRAHNFRQFLKFGNLLGWTRKLAKPIRGGLESPLRFKHLCFLNVDNEDIFESLLLHAFDRIQPDEFLLYAQVGQDIRTLPPEHWIATSQPYALYSMVFPTEAAPSFLHPSINLNPEIESFCF
jgi:hypothetical protein